MASSGGPGDDEDDGMDFFEMLGIKNRDRMDGVCHLQPVVCVCAMLCVCARAAFIFSQPWTHIFAGAWLWRVEVVNGAPCCYDTASS
jgi:hypothetical protein